jgi:hypothetical protein
MLYYVVQNFRHWVKYLEIRLECVTDFILRKVKNKLQQLGQF